LYFFFSLSRMLFRQRGRRTRRQARRV
jgi:hypothetical protein